MSATLDLVMGLRQPVSRRDYLVVGASLMVLKYGIEIALFRGGTGAWLHPFDFLSPAFTGRARLLANAPDALVWILLAVSMPFVWIGVSMSVRRAVDARWPPWLGFFFLIPGVQYLVILLLALAPSRAVAIPAKEGDYREPPQDAVVVPPPHQKGSLAFAGAVLGASTIGFGLVAAAVYGLRQYGAALFLLIPCIVSFVASLLYTSAIRRSGRGTGSYGQGIGVGCVAILVVGGLMFGAAMEGLGCLGMAMIPAFFVGTLGSMLGVALGQAEPVIPSIRSHAPLLLALPAVAAADSWIAPPVEHQVVTTVIVDAPPDVVFRHVVSFSELPPPTEALFKAGIAYPIRARIDGEGVGAVRRCEFSTGAFVEPITHWEPGRRLAFDVSENPPPMKEWSPYDIEAPHLDGFMASKRGSFDLEDLGDGRTRLVGTTVYELAIFPETYWRLWTDTIVHTIHLRVLAHVAQESEAEARESGAEARGAGR